ncbi:MAG: outer membrane protein assembly factor BamC [Pseudomonadota bacterium]|nr:outer membrane protein assembly factor BamC [Pseudomonadota bacterium]
MSVKPPAGTRLTALAAALLLLGGCSSIEGMFDGGKADYRNGGSARSTGLEIPPDLTQLAGDSRYKPQGGVVSASAVDSAPRSNAANPATNPAAVPTVAVATEGAIHVGRDGQERWLVVPKSPEQLWPQLQAFWEQAGFTLIENSPQIGVLQTEWAENRTKLPNDVIRNSIGRVLGGLYDTGERDRYRTRVERTPQGSEIYISHRGLQEIYTDRQKDSTTWVARPSDPQLEAEMLSRLMVSLGAKKEFAATAVAAAPDGPARVQSATTAGAAGVVGATGATSLVVNEAFDRAWRRVGLALDRGGFTVEDRDRAGGLYYVRYVDPRSAGQDGPSWWNKLFSGGKDPAAAVRYRVALKGEADKTTVTVQNSTGALDTGENARRIVALLTTELR